MKKSVLATLILSLGLIGGMMIAGSSTASAAKWHKGTPRVLRGSWNNNTGAHSVNFTLTPKKIDYLGYNGPMSILNPSYKYVRHNYYLIRGTLRKLVGYGKGFHENVKYAMYRKGKTLAFKNLKNDAKLHLKLYR